MSGTWDWCSANTDLDTVLSVQDRAYLLGIGVNILHSEELVQEIDAPVSDRGNDQKGVQCGVCRV